MSHQLAALEKRLNAKVDSAALSTLQEELRAMGKNKVDTALFNSTVARLATAAEVAKLNLYVADLGGGRGGGYGGVAPAEVLDTGSDLRNAEVQGLLTRFDVLGRQQLELHAYCASFVPRDEVHEAMKAVIGEVKALKRTAVTQGLFRESLKAKADITEVERIVKTITEAVGDLNINSADASAAIHAKCLICDKPVTAQRARTAGQKGRLNSASMPLLGYSKIMDEGPVSASVHQQNTMFNRLLSNSPAVSQNERAKVAVELAIMRSSIEPLPEIIDSVESGMGGHTPHQQGAQYKTRIRHSAGGGMGPNYKMDSR
ncbi:hypothetical protein B484DRAFT_262909, partial [Ochromonadaceae sp. CCMP2298]